MKVESLKVRQKKELELFQKHKLSTKIRGNNLGQQKRTFDIKVKEKHLVIL